MDIRIFMYSLTLLIFQCCSPLTIIKGEESAVTTTEEEMAATMKATPTKSLTKKQRELLQHLYVYRFMSRELVAMSLYITQNNSALHERLQVLEKYGYVGKRYTPRDRVLGKPAAYYLTPPGLKELRLEHATITEGLIRYSYRDKYLSEQFIAHCFDICVVSLKLQKLHPRLQFFTRRETALEAYIPNPQPDGFVSLRAPSGETPDRFFLDILSPQYQYQELKKKITTYARFFDDGGWDSTNSPLPILLIICASKARETAAQKQIERLFSALDVDDFECFTTTMARIEQAGEYQKQLWADSIEPDEYYALDNLPIWDDIDPIKPYQ